MDVAGRGHEDQLRRIQSVADAALAHLELDELLDELLIRIRDALGSDTAAFLLLDEATNELVARAARGLEEAVERGTRIPVGLGFAGKVAAERRTIVIEDVDHADVLNPILREKGIKSLLGAPLLVGGRVIGVVHVGTLTPRRFTEQEAELLQLVADRAALAIEHGRLFESERALADRLRRVQEVTDVALTHLSSAELLDELVVRVREILEADTCAILLLDEARDELVARAAAGLEEEVEAGVRIPVGQGFAGRLAAERKGHRDRGRRPFERAQPHPPREGDQVAARRPAARSRTRLRRDPRGVARAAPLHVATRPTSSRRPQNAQRSGSSVHSCTTV